MRAIGVVFRKEVLDNLRDRRTVFGTLLLGALLGPVIFAAMFNVLLSQEREKTDQVLELAVTGQEHAPNLIAYLRRSEVVIRDGPVDPEAAVKERLEDAVLRIPADYGQRWKEGAPARVELVMDKSRHQTGRTRNRVSALLRAYSRQTGQLRLQLRGIHPVLNRPLVVSEVDVSTPASRGAVLVNMLPFFLLMTVFMGGMYLAVDATSGEKERQSLEPLLINPVPRWQIMLGKVLASSLFSAASLVVGLLAFHYSMMTLPVASLGFRINLDWPVMAMALLIGLPLTVVASCLQCIIAAFSRGFREAQGYASMLVFFTMLPSFWLMLIPVKEQLWMSAVPLLSQVMLLNNLVRGEALPLSWVALSWLTTGLLALVLCVIAAHLYNRPRMIFSD